MVSGTVYMPRGLRFLSLVLISRALDSSSNAIPLPGYLMKKAELWITFFHLLLPPLLPHLYCFRWSGPTLFPVVQALRSSSIFSFSSRVNKSHLLHLRTINWTWLCLSFFMLTPRLAAFVLWKIIYRLPCLCPCLYPLCPACVSPTFLRLLSLGYSGSFQWSHIYICCLWKDIVIGFL